MELESFFWMQSGFAAIVRLLFRADVVPFMREHDDVFYLFLQKQNLGAKLHIYL